MPSQKKSAVWDVQPASPSEFSENLEYALFRAQVTRLQPGDALALLEQLLVRLQSRPGRGAQLSKWFKAVLTAHPAYLMAAPSARPHLTALYQILEARLALMKPLTSLAGRLDFLLAQQQQARGGPAGSSDQGPLVDYLEPDAGEELVEVEDPFAAQQDGDGDESDEEEWETDNEGSDVDGGESDDDDDDDEDM